MAEFMILKEALGAPGWRPVQIVEADTAAELRELVQQGYDDPGGYAICRWDNRREFDLAPGPVEATERAPA